MNGLTKSSNATSGESSNMNRTYATSVIIKVVGEMLFLYGLLGWTYGVLVQLLHPYWMSLPLSHLTVWIRIDTFTILSFILSAVGFLAWRISRELAKHLTQ
jgi:hypothetical protein